MTLHINERKHTVKTYQIMQRDDSDTGLHIVTEATTRKEMMEAVKALPGGDYLVFRFMAAPHVTRRTIEAVGVEFNSGMVRGNGNGSAKKATASAPKKASKKSADAAAATK
jgi:hypothetical protein